MEGSDPASPASVPLPSSLFIWQSPLFSSVQDVARLCPDFEARVHVCTGISCVLPLVPPRMHQPRDLLKPPSPILFFSS